MGKIGSALLTRHLDRDLIPKDLGFKISVIRMPEMNEMPAPTGRELEILKILWENGPSSVRGVHQHLQPSEGAESVAPNTVQTLLRIMETKGLVTHIVEGRTFIYSAVYSRHQSAARFLDRVFDGAASALVLSLLEAERISEEELDRVEALIARARRSPRTEER